MFYYFIAKTFDGSIFEFFTTQQHWSHENDRNIFLFVSPALGGISSVPTPPPSAGNVWNKGPPGTSTGGSGSTAASNGTGLPQDLLQFSTQPNRVESLFNGQSGIHFPSLFSSDPICSKINMDPLRDTHLKFIICPNLNPTNV